ncbi:MAG: hypothetical protein ACYTG3_17425 [Planctomycetota bacterium]|jgi:hypothetical protein
MPSAPVLGLAPFLPAHLPRARPRWWTAKAQATPGQLRIDQLCESPAPPAIDALCGLAAPCSLPQAFADFLGDRLESPTCARLLAEARAFAKQAPRGEKQPRRDAHETVSALDRTRLPLFHAAAPLLRQWRDLIFEVDPLSLLARLELPAHGLSGTGQDAVRRRVRVLQALQEGVLGGLAVDLRERDYAVASRAALDAVLAAAMAAWVHGNESKPPHGAETWIPLP